MFTIILGYRFRKLLILISLNNPNFNDDVNIKVLIDGFNNETGSMVEQYPALGAYDYEGTYYAFKSLGSKRYIACEKNKKEKRIICRIAREADEVNIFVENSIEQLVLAENQSLETTKDKKDQHGMGHLIVEEQVKRLGGMVEYYEDEMFCAHVYLPV